MTKEKYIEDNLVEIPPLFDFVNDDSDDYSVYRKWMGKVLSQAYDAGYGEAKENALMRISSYDEDLSETMQGAWHRGYNQAAQEFSEEIEKINP